VLDGSPVAPRAEAILTNFGGQQQLQIDVNGDGVIGAGDISVFMSGLSGTLSDANFAVITPNHAPTSCCPARSFRTSRWPTRASACPTRATTCDASAGQRLLEVLIRRDQLAELKKDDAAHGVAA